MILMLCIRILHQLLTTPVWWLVRGPFLAIVINHVARAGFTLPPPMARIDPATVGVTWQGRVLAPGDRLPTSEVHYLKHVLAQREWPAGTTLPDYLASIEAVIRDPASGILVSRYRNRWRIAFIRQSGVLQGPLGYAYVMVEYDVLHGHWMTSFQPSLGLGHFNAASRRDHRWLRQPR